MTKSDFSKDYFQKVASQTVNLASINMRNLGDLPIPICPFEEQKEIVRQVDRFFALADKMEDHYKKAKEKIEKLPQSILAKAFRGELVPQDPNDEPTQVLLEKIKAQKALIEAEKKTKLSKRKK
jgi:type I restriction enzyme S subunit